MSTATALKPGSRLGKYRVMRRVGVGGMAEVFVATAEGAEGFEKRVALKRMLPFVGENSDFERRFVREARISAGLQHPNIGQVFDFGKEEGHLYIALEFVDGIDLARLLSESRDRNIEIPLGSVLSIAIGLASGLRYAHEAKGSDKQPLGLVHRDVTPSNILISYSGHVKLIDFGIAKATQEVTQSSDGSLKGKLRYMSPEQIHAQDLDARCDVFAAGVVLWETLTRRRLFQAPSSAAILRLITSPETPLPSLHRYDLPPRLEDIVLRALERNRERRYQSARDLLADLEAFARDARLDTSPDALAEFLEDLVPRQTIQPVPINLATEVLADHTTDTTIQSLPPPTMEVDRPRKRSAWPRMLAVLALGAAITAGGFVAWQKLAVGSGDDGAPQTGKAVADDADGAGAAPAADVPEATMDAGSDEAAAASEDAGKDEAGATPAVAGSDASPDDAAKTADAAADSKKSARRTKRDRNRRKKRDRSKRTKDGGGGKQPDSGKKNDGGKKDLDRKELLP